MVTRLSQRHITRPHAIRWSSPGGELPLYLITHLTQFRSARNRTEMAWSAAIPAWPGPEVIAAQEPDEWTGGPSSHILNSALWRVGRYGAMGCGGARTPIPGRFPPTRTALT